MGLTPCNGSSITLNFSKMANYQHEKSRNVTVTTARIVCHHQSTISRFENKNQAINDVKDLPRSRRPHKPSSRENQA